MPKKILVATLKSKNTLHVMHSIDEDLVIPPGFDSTYRTFTDYTLNEVVGLSKAEGFDYIFLIDSNVIFPTTTLIELLGYNLPYVFAIAPKEDPVEDFIGCRLIELSNYQGEKAKYLLSLSLVSINDKTKIITGRRTHNKYCINKDSPYAFLLKPKIRSNIRVQFACPRRDEADIPVTDFTKLTRNFLAYYEEETLMPVGLNAVEAYEYIIDITLNREQTHLVIIESDVLAPVFAVDKLLTSAILGKHAFVCGIYPFKDGSDICVAVSRDEQGYSLRLPDPYKRRGLVPCTRATPMGCCIIDLEVVRNLTRPLFDNAIVDGEEFSQDTFLTTRFVQAGYMPMVDTDIQCIHIDRTTGECFGSPDFISGGKLLKDRIHQFAVAKVRN